MSARKQSPKSLGRDLDAKSNNNGKNIPSSTDFHDDLNLNQDTGMERRYLQAEKLREQYTEEMHNSVATFFAEAKIREKLSSSERAKIRNSYALKIQSIWRGREARKNVKKNIMNIKLNVLFSTLNNFTAISKLNS